MTNDEKVILDKSLWQERVIKKHKQLYYNIYNFNNLNNNDSLKFIQKIYNYYYNISTIPCCKICNNPVNFQNKKYNTYCSVKCMSSDKEVKEKRIITFKKTMVEDHGVDSPFKIPNIKEKIRKNNIEKWGNEIASKSKIIRSKISHTNLSKSDEEKEIINKKRTETTLNKWGVSNVSKSDIIKKRTKNNNIEKWGVEYPIQLDHIKELRSSNYFSKNGIHHHFHDNSILENMQIKRKESIRDNYLNSISHLGLNIIEYNNKSLKINCDKCNLDYDISVDLLYQRRNKNMEICTNCNSIYNKVSSYENHIVEFLKENNISNIETSNRTLIKKELDIYIPEYKLAIEFNGNYWHSEIHKSKKYHLEKTKKCESLNIDLIHIFEDDWLYKKDIIKSIILNKLNLSKERIYARKCEIRKVSVKDTRKFLNNNHIQGFSKSNYKLGLYHNEKLVSLMTFGYRNINSKKEFELIRFCNKLNTNVIGGASKLFNHFINNYSHKFKIKSIISYADISIFNGNLYKKLGFEYSHRSEVNYYWVIDGVRKHRFNYNKKVLIKEGFDPNKTEVEIMYDRGYYRIWGCGQDKYIFYL